MTYWLWVDSNGDQHLTPYVSTADSGEYYADATEGEE